MAGRVQMGNGRGWSGATRLAQVGVSDRAAVDGLGDEAIERQSSVS